MSDTAALHYSFAGKRVLVTGGGQGIGLGVIAKLYKDGAQVFTLEKNPDLVSQLKKDFPGITAEIVDVTKWDEVQQKVKSFGPLDHLVNNVAAIVTHDLLTVTEQQVDLMLQLNLKSTIAISQAVAKEMIAGNVKGTIVNLGSIGAHIALDSCAFYCATKTSILMLTRCLARELSPYGIRCNSFSSTSVDTSMYRKVMETMPAADNKANYRSRQPLEKITCLEMDEAVNGILFLLSPLSLSMSSLISSVVDTESGVDLLSKARSEVKAVMEAVKKSKENVESEGSSCEEEEEEEGEDDEEEGEDDEEEEEEEEEDDEEEDEEEKTNIANYAQLADLTQEINRKERLFEELENSQSRLESLKQKYEEKLNQLETRIKLTEDERDAVMSKSTMSADKSKEYEHKIQSLQAELKKWNNAKKEHAKLLKNQLTYESQVGKLRREIDDTKRIKVKLMNQVTNENLTHREEEKVRMKEEEFSKEARVKDINVRKLEGDQRMKEAVLKRKLEEVEMLKARVREVGRGSGVKGASRVKEKLVLSRVPNFLMKDVSEREAIANLEREMVNHISQRTEQNERLALETDPETRDSIGSNLRMVEQRIREVQEDVVSLNQSEEETGVKGRAEKINIGGRSRFHDIAYVFDKIYEQLVSVMTETSSLKGEVKKVERINRQLKAEVDNFRELIQHMHLYKSPQGNPPSEPVLPHIGNRN